MFDEPDKQRKHGRNHKTTIKFTTCTHSLHASRFIPSSLVPQKAFAGDDGLNEIPEAFAITRHRLADLGDGGSVATV